MVLKIWDSEKGKWIFKDGFCEIQHSKTVDETKGTVTRTVQCYYSEQNYTDCIVTNTIAKDKEFDVIYILNDDGKTIERIN
jgi:hypothetical protein